MRNSRLAGIEQIKAPHALEHVNHVYHLYVIRAEKRDELQNYLKENGIGVAMHYPIPLHLTQAYAHLGHKKGDFPVAEKLADEILSLPMFPELSEVQIDYVCKKIEDYLKS